MELREAAELRQVARRALLLQCGEGFGGKRLGVRSVGGGLALGAREHGEFERVHGLADPLHVVAELLQLRRLLRRGEVQDGRGLRAAAAAGDGGLVEEGDEAVVVAHRVGIELVVVAARAVHRRGEPDGADGLGLLEEILDAVLLRDAPALAVNHVVAHEARGELLVARGVGEQITGELPEGELVVRQVVVERLHGPITPRPHGALLVALVAVRVRVTRGVEPLPNHALTVARAGEQAVHDGLVSLGRLVREEGIHLGGRGRQAGEVERHATEERLARGLGRGAKAVFLQTREDEGVEGIANCELRIANRRDGWAHRRGERPVRRVVRAGVNPPAHRLNLRGRERLLALGRRHHLVRVLRGEPLEEFALRGLAGDDHGTLGAEQTFLRVEPELRLAGLLIRAVALKAVLGEDGQHLAVEVRRRLGRGRGEGRGRDGERGEREQSSAKGVEKGHLVSGIRRECSRWVGEEKTKFVRSAAKTPLTGGGRKRRVGHRPELACCPP